MVSISILQTHEPKILRGFIKEANKGIRAKISEEIKEERKEFSAAMRAKRKIEKEKRIIQIPKGSKKDDLIKIIMDNKKHFKDIKKNVSKEDKIKELDNLIKNEREKIKSMNSKELNELSKKYMDFKNLVGLDNFKHKGIVREINKREQELKKPKAQLGESGIGKKRKREVKPSKKKVVDIPAKKEESVAVKLTKEFFKEKGKAKAKPKEKPKIPTITITEEEKPKKKVIKVGGRFITPKPKAEPKATPPPKSKPIKIRLPKEEKPKKKSIGDLLKENNLTFKRYNKEAKMLYDKETNKNASIVQEVKLSSNKRDLFVTYLTPEKERKKRVLALKEIGEKNIKKSKAEVAKELKKKQDKVTKESRGGGAAAAGAAEEELQDLSKFKKSEGDKATTDAFIDAVEKRLKEDAAKMDELNKARAKETERLIKALEAQQALEKQQAQQAQQAETTDEEPDEIPYKDFKLIEGVPKNIKKIFYEYVDDRTGYASPYNQREEIEELKRIEKNYIEAEATRKNKSLSAKKQLKAVQTIGSILIETRNDINNNPDLKKLYKVFTPVILKRVLDQKKKDEEDLKKEQKEIEKQEKEDAKALKKAEAAEKK